MSDAVDSLATEAGVSRAAMLEALKHEGGTPDDYQPKTAYGQPIAARHAMDAPLRYVRDVAEPTGAMVGGWAGIPAGPLGIGAGAMLGGAGGRAVSNMAKSAMGEHAPAPFSLESVLDMMKGAREGLTQEATADIPARVIEEGVRAARPAVGRMANRAMGNALNPGKELFAEDRALVPNAVREEVPISADWDAKGSNEITKRFKASSAAEDETAAATDAAQTFRVQPSEVLAQMEQKLRASTPGNKRTTVADSPEWQARARQLLSDYSDQPTNPHAGETGAERPFNIFSALQAKRGADRASLAAHDAFRRGDLRPTNIGGEDPSELFDRTLGDVLRDNLRTAVPSLGRQMQRTRELIPLEHAYMQAESRGSGIAEGGVVKNLVRQAMSPSRMSRAAIRGHRFSNSEPDLLQTLRTIGYAGAPAQQSR